MSWMRTHPYTAVCAGAGIALIIGALIVERRTAAPVTTLSVWGDGGAPLINPAAYAPEVRPSRAPVTGGDSGPLVTYIPPSTPGRIDAAPPASLDDLLLGLTQPKGTSHGTAELGVGAFAYSLIPTGLIATSAPPAKERTEAQEALFTYGNDAASYVQRYETTYRDAPVVLRDQAEDRQSPEKARNVKEIAGAIKSVGENLLSMDRVPTSAQSAHQALAESYIKAGEALARVPDAVGDEGFIAAIEAYNAAADALVKRYVALSSVFALMDVSFSDRDAGSLFVFTSGGGL